MKIRVRNVRLAFPALFQPRAFGAEDSAPAYSASFILEGQGTDPVVEVARPQPDGTTKWQETKLWDVLLTVARDKWGAKGEQNFRALKSSGKLCVRDGADKAAYSGFEGNLYISARNPQVKPLVLGPDRKELDPDSGKLYAGCYVHAVLDIYAQDNAYGKRINASIGTVMFAKDGEAFGGGARGSADDLADLAVADDVSDLI